jgi:hypothetical protein
MKANSTKRWVRFIEELCSHYNSQIVPGTTMKRSQIHSGNYMRFLNQLYRTSDASLYFNSFSLGAFSKDMGAKLFKFNIGDKVLLSIKANWKLKKGAFSKPSVEGNFGEEVFRVVSRSLKHSSKFFITPCYELSNISGLFYESELVSAANF